MVVRDNDTVTLKKPSERELVITRVFDAPRELVWQALTRPEHVARWYGLRRLTLTVCEIDLQPGGAWRYVMRDPHSGGEYGFSGVYREITPPERLVSTEGYEAMPGHEYLVTVTLSEHDGKTTLQSHLVYQSVEDRDGHLNSGMEAGMRETYDRLAEHLGDMVTAMVTAMAMADSSRGDRAATNALAGQVVITRLLDAPRELVWRAWTEPERVSRWWGPRIFTSPVNKIDLRVGGRYLSCMRSPDGQDYWSTGVYREIVPPERLVMSDSFADPEGNVVPASYYGMSGDWPLEMEVTVTFEDQGGKTKLTLTHSGVVGISAGDLGNMEQGWSESFDKLAEYLARLSG